MHDPPQINSADTCGGYLNEHVVLAGLRGALFLLRHTAYCYLVGCTGHGAHGMVAQAQRHRACILAYIHHTVCVQISARLSPGAHCFSPLSSSAPASYSQHLNLGMVLALGEAVKAPQLVCSRLHEGAPRIGETKRTCVCVTVCVSPGVCVSPRVCCSGRVFWPAEELAAHDCVIPAAGWGGGVVMHFEEAPRSADSYVGGCTSCLSTQLHAHNT